WAEYFQEVYGSREEETGGINEESYTPAPESEDPQTQQEIAEIIRKLKNNVTRGKRSYAENPEENVWREEEGGVWKRRTNREVMELYEKPSITNIAGMQRMRWLRHMGRMEIERSTK
ncbi:hypothetical protein ILUMI_15700, partial [Ignelater luminosus]